MKNYWTQSKTNIYVAAHRGLSAKYPENTIEAFQAAVDVGVDQLETDVRLSRDGELVLMHDPTVDRTTAATGNVADMTLSELKALGVPTLREFMELVKDLPDMTLDIELKLYPEQVGEAVACSVCDRVLAMLDAYHYTERCVINTFSCGLHEYILKQYGGTYKQHVYFPLAKMVGTPTIDPYSYGYCTCMGGSNIMADKADFEAMRAKGVRTWAGAKVKDAAGVDKAVECGAELITCNNPDEILKLLRTRGLHR